MLLKPMQIQNHFLHCKVEQQSRLASGLKLCLVHVLPFRMAYPRVALELAHLALRTQLVCRMPPNH
jgi:hypothetical protein